MNRRNRGTALFVVVATMATLAMLSTTLFMMVHGALDRERTSRDVDTVLLLARAGLNKAAAEFASGNQAYIGELSTAFGNGEFTVAVTPGESSGVYRVESTGAVTDGPYVLRSCTLAAEMRVGTDRSVRIGDITRTQSTVRRMGPVKP